MTVNIAEHNTTNSWRIVINSIGSSGIGMLKVLKQVINQPDKNKN